MRSRTSAVASTPRLRRRLQGFAPSWRLHTAFHVPPDPRTLGLRRERPDTGRVPTCQPCFMPAAPMGLAQDPAEGSPPQQVPCLSARRACGGVRCTSPGVSSAMARSSPGPWAPPRFSPAGRRPDHGSRCSRRPPGAEAPRAPRLRRAPRPQRPLMGFPGSRLPRLPEGRRRGRRRGGPPECCSACGWPGPPKRTRQTFMGLSTSSLIRAPRDSACDAR